MVVVMVVFSNERIRVPIRNDRKIFFHTFIVRQSAGIIIKMMKMVVVEEIKNIK